MAFYKDVPNRHAHKPVQKGRDSWEEEGSRYTGASRRFGPNADDDRPSRGGYRSNNDYRDNRGGYRNDDRRDNRGGYRSDDRRDNRGGYRNDDRRDFNRDDRRDNRSSRSQQRFEAKKPVEPAQRSFHDYEYRPAKPVTEETPVTATETITAAENLLAGRNPIREAIRSGRDIEKLLVQRGELSGSAREIVQMARAAHIVVQEVEKSRLDEIARNHQGMLAFASAYQYSTVEAMLEEAAEKNEDPFLILLDGVTDPHNLGAIIRSAECVGAHGVIVPERRSVGLTPAAVKSSAGAVEHMKVARVTNLNRTIEDLKKRGIWAYAVTMNGEDYQSVNFKGGVALVIGAEGEGISRLTLENCDHRVSLPMNGHIDSLNASVAAGVMMYRVLASRKA